MTIGKPVNRPDQDETTYAAKPRSGIQACKDSDRRTRSAKTMRRLRELGLVMLVAAHDDVPTGDCTDHVACSGFLQR